MNAKTMLIGFVTLIFGASVVTGAIGAFKGYNEMLKGRRVGNSQMEENGQEALIFGFLQAGGSTAFLTGIIAAINNLQF